ncbi:SfiI-subtelomeric fragment related protein family member, putative [Theileria annulata]|uniref:SfiI-subtelomeric related protein family member, putative n=1 Tax=Theileria annulata TaxID=5874 RepID=Q4UGJ6_THEAN|nr:SfiI-subtelomeric fragment related protein family member, putative [Theileria annulata]CAI73793.1 SfiI-subtelomeric fragment related protein family member, putative [Theileria annulata]
MRIGYIFRYLFIYLLLNDGEKFVISSDQETSLKGSSQSNGSFSADSSGSVAIPSEVGLFTTDGSGNYVKLEQSKVKVVQDGAEYSFEFESGVQLTKVEHNSSKVWEHEENKPYPKSVAYKSDEKLFAIISDTEIVNCKFENNQWKFQIDVLGQSSPKTSVTNVELNLSASAGTNQFEYNRTGDTAEFKAKAGHEFTAVIGTSGTDGVSGRVIWKPMNPNENATRVVLDGVDNNDKKLTIHKKNNEKVEFTKSSTNKNWEEVVTKVELELSKTTSTNEFDYDKKNELTSFIAKDGYGFTKVLKAKATDFSREEQVWEADTSSNNFAKLVRLKLNDNHIVLILNNAEFILFHKVAEDQDWKDITNDRHKLSELKFFTFDQSKSLKELDSTYYKVELNGFSYGYTFKDDFELQQIKYQNKLVYNYHSDEDFGLLKGLYLGLSSNKFFITNYDDESKELDVSKEVVIKREAPPAEPAKPAEPKPKPKPEPAKEPAAVPEPENTIEPVSVTIPTLSPVELKINKSSAENEFDYDDIGVYKTFSCRQGFGFNKIVNPKTFGADEVIWQSSGNDYATKVRFKETSGTNEKQVLLFLASMKYAFLHSDKGKPFQNVTSDRHKFYNLKVYTLQNDVEKIAKPDQYTISLYHMSIGCTIKNEYPCSKIIYEDKVVYKKDDYQDLGQIKGVYLDLIRNSMYVIGINDQTKVLEAMKTAKEFTLNIRKDESTDEFDFIQDYQKNVRIFTARGNAVFTKVIRGARLGSDELIWQSKDIKVYGTKVVTDGLSDFKRAKNVTIHLSNGDVKHLNYSDGNWIQVSNKISLDITKTESSIQFDFYTKNEFTTFTVKDVYLFNKVIESKTIGTETVIWETTNTSEYSKKVTLMVTGDEKYMGLLRTDDDVILLHKPPNSDTWDNITSKVTKISELKMSYYDPSGSYFMLKPEKYKVAFNNLLYGYEFNSGVDCHLVKFGDKHLWSHSDDDKFKNIKAVYVYLRNNNFIVVSPSGERKEISLRSLSSDKEQQEDQEEDDGDKETKSEGEDKTKDDKEQEGQDENQDQDGSSGSTPATLVELDITKTETTNEYEYEEENDNRVFKTKAGFKFSKVKKGTHDLKDLSSSHAIKITANYNQPGKILLYLYRTNTDFEFSLVNDPDPSSSQASVPSDSGTLLADQSQIVSQHFKLLAEDASGTSQEFDKQKLTTEQQLESHLINYTFPPNAKCSEVTYKDATVWKHDKSIHGKNYLTNVFLNTNTSFLMVESQGHYQYYYTLLNDEWKCISGYRSHTLKLLSLDSLKIFTLNQFGFLSTDDETQFTKKADGNVITFKFKAGSKCVSVKYGGEQVWSHNNNDHGNHYPDTIIVNTNQNFLTLESSNVYRYVFSHYDGTLNCIFAYKSSLSQPIEKDKLKLSKVGNLGLIKPAEATDYEVKESDTEYKFKPGSNCTCIKYNDTEVWKHTTQHGDKYPTSVVFNNLNRNYLVVESTRNYRNIFQFENSQFKSLGANEKLNHDHNSTGVFDPGKLKFMTTDPSDSSKLVDLDLSKYSLHHPTLITFKFKESVKCAEVRYDDLLVWKYLSTDHEEEFPTAVVLNRAKNYIFVESSHYYRYVYSYYNRRWKELPFGFKTLRILSDKFKIFATDPSDTNKFVELDNSKFERVYSSNALTINFTSDVKCTCIKYDDSEVWKYNYDEHEDKFPTSVVLNTKNKFIMVESGYDYRYVYSRQNNIWKLLPYGYKLSESTKIRPADPTKIKLFTMDNNTTVQVNELKYDVEEPDESKNLFVIKFKSDAKCSCIKYVDTDVWIHSSNDHGDKYPTSLVLNKKKNYIMVESGYDYRYSYLFYNRKWNLLPVSYNHIRSFDHVDPNKLKFFHLNQNMIIEEITSFPTNEQGESSKSPSSNDDKGDTSEKSDTNEQGESGDKIATSEQDESSASADSTEQSSSSNGVSSDDSVSIYNIPENMKCVLVKYDDIEVWRYSDIEHQDKYPNRILLYKKTATLIVESSSNYEYVYTYEDKIWKLTPFGARLKVIESIYDLDKLKLSSVNLSNKTFVLENINHYNLQQSGKLARYTFINSSRCTEVVYDDKLVWKYNEDEHGEYFPTNVTMNLNTGIITVESKGLYESYFSYYDNKWNLLYGYKASFRIKFKESAMIKFYITNEDGLSEPTTDFHKEVTGPVITYNMYYGTKCTHVKYDELSVWTYDSDKHGNHYPTSVVFNVGKMVITVQSSDQYVQFLSLINHEWKPFSGFRSQATGPSEVKFYKKGRSDNQVLVHHSKYTVIFDENTNEYVYNLEKANCNEIRHNGNPVFKLDQNERYPKEVLCSSDVKKITVILKESYHVCTMDSNGWKSKIHKNDGSSSEDGPEYPFVTSTKPAVPTSEAATETQSPESDTSQSASSPSGTTSEDFDLSQALDPSQKGSQVSTTPKSQSASSESGTTSEEFDLSQALDSSQTSSQVSTTPPTESQPPSSPTSSSTAGLDSDPTSGTFME